MRVFISNYNIKPKIYNGTRGLEGEISLLAKKLEVHFYKLSVLSNRCGCLHKSCNGIPVQALVFTPSS